MAALNPNVAALLGRLRELREKAGLDEAQLEERLILGPGWIERFETGRSIPSLDMLLAMLHALGFSPNDLFSELPADNSAAEVERYLFALPDGSDLLVHFRYAEHDAVYRLENATVVEFEDVLKTLRNGLARLAATDVRDADDTDEAKAIKTDAVARSFLRAVSVWPHANPSDLWWFLIYRAYCDPFNHPAAFARLDLGQSWRRTGGWALEEILVRFYGPHLAKHGVRLFIAQADEKSRFLAQLKVADRLEADKVDVLLVGNRDGRDTCFGVVHVKASFAERRTDDVPMSKALVEAGYVSPLWTMDCKGSPSASPENRGELGSALAPGGRDTRSAKRKDIEDDGYFSACFSYNRNTIPTPAAQAARSRIVVCDFSSPDDDFSRFVLENWNRLSPKK